MSTDDMIPDDMMANDMMPDGASVEAVVTEATGMDVVTAAQPLLFDSLPETQTRAARRKPRRARTTVAATVSVDVVQEPVPAPPPAIFAAPPPLPAPPQPAPAAFDPAALSNPEISALVRALPDLRLSHLLVEAARELKRRVEPPAWDDEDEAGPREPNPSLLRAARLVVGEFAGDGD